MVGDIMKIIKYKKGKNGKYSVFLDDGREFLFYEEVILKYNLLIKKEVLEKDLEEINQSNLEYDVYYVALNSIKNRYRSTYELKELLIKKEYPVDLVDKAINKLLDQGYLNDRSFAKSYINMQIITTNHGPNRIKNDLEKEKIDYDIISEEIESFSVEDQKDKIKKIIDYRIKTNRSRCGVVLQKKIYNDLLLLGYDSSLINSILGNYSFKTDKDIAKKEYDKLYRKYSSKYSGYELERKIKEKLYLKGIVYEEE